jgi:hypothetical protein
MEIPGQISPEIDTHIFILDINGEYASAFLPKASSGYVREPNEAYVNGIKASLPIWLMNSEEVCEWLSASEQTQQPVLKAWWAYLKSGGLGTQSKFDFLENALASIAEMRSDLPKQKKKEVGSFVDNILSFAQAGGLSPDCSEITKLKEITDAHRTVDKYNTEKVDNPADMSAALTTLAALVEATQLGAPAASAVQTSGDTPAYFPKTLLSNTSSLAGAASAEDAPKIEQHLTTLRMRLRTRLADTRWGVFTNYDDLGIRGASDWFKSLGFASSSSRVTVFDLSMLAHEVLPFICAIIGRVLLETREKLAAGQRFQSPWVIVLEEAHNYARPPRQSEDRWAGAFAKDIRTHCEGRTEVRVIADGSQPAPK